jgi:pimeloyl-ACP methyl ester carboxylesterase
MQRAPVDGVELEYEDRGGAGDPVVLIHAGACADFFAPLADQRALAGHRLVRYHRAGYAGSDPVPGPLSFAGQAAHCRALMGHLGIDRAHVVGHSSSAAMALQLALDSPEAVQTLALLDPARPAAPTPLNEEMVRTVLGPAAAHYRAGDPAAAVDTFLSGVCGPGYREPLEAAIPGAFEQAVADADAFFGQELQAVIEWSSGREEVARVRHPALVVRGERSVPVYRERFDLLLDWLPDAEGYTLPRATHLLQVENPGPLAGALAAFFARHPVP